MNFGFFGENEEEQEQEQKLVEDINFQKLFCTSHNIYVIKKLLSSNFITPTNKLDDQSMTKFRSLLNS